MQVRQLFDAETSTCTYLVYDPETRKALLIDSVREKVLRDLALIQELDLDLVYVADTHLHADHVTGAGAVRERSGALSVISVRAGVDCADIKVDHGDRLAFGGLEMRVIATPGHTDGCVSYHIGHAVFTGDALFVRGCGRTDFQQGNPAELYRSVTERLFVLPDATIVYPGHDYRGHTQSTIGEEKRFNPRLGAQKSEQDFVTIMQELKLAPPNHIHEAVPRNRSCGSESRFGEGNAGLRRVAGWP
jgi:glyoxylase-like metal-dependent hydrolase (beta-lactamase superfamily II)